MSVEKHPYLRQSLFVPINVRLVKQNSLNPDWAAFRNISYLCNLLQKAEKALKHKYNLLYNN